MLLDYESVISVVDFLTRDELIENFQSNNWGYDRVSKDDYYLREEPAQKTDTTGRYIFRYLDIHDPRLHMPITAGLFYLNWAIVTEPMQTINACSHLTAEQVDERATVDYVLTAHRITNFSFSSKDCQGLLLICTLNVRENGYFCCGLQCDPWGALLNRKPVCLWGLAPQIMEYPPRPRSKTR